MEKTVKSSDGTRIAYYDSEKGNEAVLFLHGWVGNRTQWKNHIEHFEKLNYRVIVPDLRGYGLSEAPIDPEKYTFDYNAMDVDAILEKERISKANLVGYSMGGMISIIFYSLFPEKVRTLTLVMSSYKGPENQKHKAELLKFIDAAEKKKIENKMSDKIGDKNVDFSKENFLYASIEVALASSLPTFAYLEQILRFDAEEVLSKITVPTLIIAGTKDALISHTFSEFMNKMIKNSRCKMVDFGHSFPVKNPISRKMISDFLEERR